MNRTKCLQQGQRDLAWERMSESFGFMVYQLPISALYIFNHIFVQKCERGFVIACPGASLRSVNIRRHRSPTRGIIAVFSGKNLLDFRRTRRLTFPRLRRARKLDVPGVCQPKTAPTRLREVSYHWAVGEQQGGYRNRLRKVFQPFTSCCLLQKDRLAPRAL